MAIANRGSGHSRLRKKTDEHQLETAGMMRWLLTYADMITLLLALFIILFSISTINKVKLQRLVRDLGGGFASPDALNEPKHGGLNSTGTGSIGDANLALIERRLRDYIARNHLEAKVQTRLDSRGLVITLLTDKALYDSGSAQLRPQTRSILDQIDGALKKTRNEIRVEGNTDNVPIATPFYPTNWELSAARATGVTRYLVEHGRLSPTRISLAGYGEFRPTHKNDNEAHRQLNRRVDIVVLNIAAAQAHQATPEQEVTSNLTDPGATATITRPSATPAKIVQHNGDGPSAEQSSASDNVAARSARGPQAELGGRGAWGGAPSK